ncbi:MAG: histidine phosphatase family protein, partial [Hymenobacteraceae bacterium]|nr:histidine phosphatase family protein [Hymenobacteraceae bacterium]MDX5396121.1 histidine phosphatase family protein [Hymenobacteraceae bacterium]MDX5443958.1 histidine phosphatase family protein [Hymenobacteraceae bacterium]MDX5512182.1 histidine phosphatase family protein [Hymenobacteraceae bacterium]
MKKTLTTYLWLGLVLLMPLLFACKEADPVTPAPHQDPPPPPATTIYIVRHAEKDASNPSNPDPGLSADGQERALALLQKLEKDSVAALYATPYKRTNFTLKPLADARKLSIITYQPTDYAGLVKQIKDNYLNKTVVVAGHSNTVLEIVEALGANKPVPALTESDYDYLFKVVIPKEGAVTAEALRYGKSSK